MAIDLLCDLASDAQKFQQCGESIINALATLDKPRARELLLSFVDPAIRGIAHAERLEREDVLVARLADLARRSQDVATHIQGLCEDDLPEFNRRVLSNVMESLATPKALGANLTLLDDAKASPIPQGVGHQLESAFVELRPNSNEPNIFTRHPRAFNELRARLFSMVLERRSVFCLNKFDRLRCRDRRSASVCDPVAPGPCSGGANGSLGSTTGNQ